MFAIYGLSLETPIAIESVMAMTHPEDREITQDRLDRDLRGEASDSRPQIRILRPSGEIRFVVGDTRLERDQTGEVLAMVGTLIDVTEQREAARILAESEARYRLLAENSTDMIVTSTLDGRTLYVSPAGSNLTGYSVEETTGIRTLDLVHPDDRAAMIEAFQALMAGAEPERVRWRGKHKNGGWTWFESRPAVVSDPKTGHLAGFVDVVRDVTTQVAQEEDLKIARAAAEAATAVKTEFLANMSHELRTPLTSILGFSDLLRRHIDGSEEGLRYIDRVAGASQALMSIVNDILDFSKLEAGQVEIDRRVVAPAQMIDAALQLLAPQAGTKGLSLNFEASDGVPPAAMLDDTRVRQLVLNLAGNAVKFTADGGVTVRLSMVADLLRCEIIDTGPGIPADRLDRLFQRFSQVDASTTRSHGGTGLGLAICKGLVEAMSGTIGAESREGVGSTFWFELPCEAVEPALCGGIGTEQPDCPFTAFEGLRILVADDNPMNQELIRLLLTSSDIEVTVVVSGEEALEAATVAPFDIILMDIRMPGLGGLQSARQIRGIRGPNCMTPILAFTADADSGTPPPDWLNVFDDRVTKPIVPADLFRTLAQWSPQGVGADVLIAAHV